VALPAAVVLVVLGTATAVVRGLPEQPAQPDAAPPAAADAPASPSPTTEPSPSPSAAPRRRPPPPVWPLTGRVAPSKHAAQRRVIAVKVDNTPAAAPWQGLGAADLVVEQLVEGGLTRLVAFYHSALRARGPLVVGPVRSVRASDAGIVRPVRAVLAASGGAWPSIRAVADAGVPIRQEGQPGFGRDYSRPAPYNLMLDVQTLERAVVQRRPGQHYLAWASPRKRWTEPPGAVPADTVTARFSGWHATTLTTTPTTAGSPARWARSVDPGGYRARTVLVLAVPTRAAGYLDPAGYPVPETVTTGRGRGLLLTVRDGAGARAVAAPIRWHKPSRDAAWRLQDRRGRRVQVPPGRVYLALVPQGTSSVQTQHRSVTRVWWP
jgi:hypothetical protein